MFASADLTSLKSNERLADFRVDHLYSDSDGRIVGAKFFHVPTGAPVFLLQLETAPQLFTWVDSPVDSNRGLPHALEHLLALKGVKGRYLNLLKGMRLSAGGAATSRDNVYYGLSSASGRDSFFEQLHALLDALYRPDFIDIEAEREFYHFAVVSDKAGQKTLIETGTVYNEMLSTQYRYDYIYELSKRVLGEHNPLAFDSSGTPDAMRTVTPSEIRRFHEKYYRLGPGTGFIFSFPPNEDVQTLLQRISEEFKHFSSPERGHPTAYELKYPIHPSSNLAPGIYPFPGPSETSSGFVHFSWVPARTRGLLDLTLLDLFFHSIAGGEESLLQKALIDGRSRTVDLGATGVGYEISTDYSPLFPIIVLEVSGMPGNRISSRTLEELRSAVVGKMREVADYPDGSAALRDFNRAVESYGKSARRSNSVWVKSPPGFGAYPPKTAWKELLERLETNPSFIRGLSEEREWESIDQQLRSGRNIWRDLIYNFRLAEAPYVTATAPSPKLLTDIENRKKERVQNKILELKNQYHTNDDQEALSLFEQDELTKTKAIDELDTKVARPRFTDHPPLVPDPDLRYSQFQISGVPVIASIFGRPPTIDIGVSFDLRQVPRRFYKYFPLFPKYLDSIGLKKDGQIMLYSDLSRKIQEDVFGISTAYEVNPVSGRADFTIRASAVDAKEFGEALELIRQMMEFDYLETSNLERLQDIVTQRLSADNLYFKQDASTTNSGFNFRYQDDPLTLALSSRFTGVHLSGRLKWLLHSQVSSAEIDELKTFAKDVLSSASGLSSNDIARKLEALSASGLQKEVLEYWRSNLAAFPETELVSGLTRLYSEVVEDLKTGPVKTIEDLKELQKIILDRHALRIDLTLSEIALRDIRKNLTSFVDSIPERPFESEPEMHSGVGHLGPLAAKLEKRYQSPQNHPPSYVGFVNSNRTGGDVIFYADFPGYSQLDRKTLIRILASDLFSGVGPHSFQMRTLARGLTYHNSIFSSPAVKRLWYYADRSPDIPSLINFVNEMASAVSELKDPNLVDYALSNVFTFSRSNSSFSDRGKAAAQDIRDGNEPEKVRRFSEAILSLRQDPNLLSELTSAGLAAICGVLVRDDCKEQQRSDNSLFFFVGSEQILSDVEKRLSIPNFRKLYPSDFWVDF